MHPIRHIATLTAALTAAVIGLVIAGPAAFATFVPPNPQLGHRRSPPTAAVTASTTTTSGLAGWEIGLIAAGGLILALVVVAVLRARLRTNLRPAMQ